MRTSTQRYAVVSCHVERLLDDRVWHAFSRLQERRPGGFAIAGLLRPPDAAAGEDEAAWLHRARIAAARGPLGHHTHWTSPTHARPTPGGEEPGARVLREGRWLRDQGLEPTLFCGGGWYADAATAAACATLGYRDCTPRARRPPALSDADAWAQHDVPGRLRLPGGAGLEVLPTTHSVGDLVRAVLRPRALPDVVHAYFHDTDLLDARRRRALAVGLRLLALRRRPVAADAATLPADARELDWSEVARGQARTGPQ